MSSVLLQKKTLPFLSNNKYHILLVDDDVMIRRLFGGKLAMEGYNVMYASNGDEGRELARRFSPDLILMDINMPGFEDGYAVAARLKSEEKTKNIPIVFLTNMDLSYEGERMLKEGIQVNGYIHKSLGFDQFLEKIKTILK